MSVLWPDAYARQRMAASAATEQFGVRLAGIPSYSSWIVPIGRRNEHLAIHVDVGFNLGANEILVVVYERCFGRANPTSKSKEWNDRLVLPLLQGDVDAVAETVRALREVTPKVERMQKRVQAWVAKNGNARKRDDD